MQFPQIKNLIKGTKKDEFAKYMAFIPSYKAEKTQKFTTIFLTLTASIILGIFAINPTLSTIGNLQKQIDDDKFVESKLEEKINNLSILQEKYIPIQEDLPIIYSAVPKTTEMSLLIGQLQSIAQSSNIKIDIIQTFETDNVSSPALYGDYSSFDFEISGQGNYQDIQTFISSLINFQRVITLGNISLSKSRDINNSGLIFDIKGTAFLKE
jgi:Tfp pilus assembly protein PilO